MLQSIVLECLRASLPPTTVRNEDKDFYDRVAYLANPACDGSSFLDSLTKQLAQRWLSIKKTANSYCRARNDWLNQLCLQLALKINPNHPYVLLMPDLKGQTDTFGNLFDDLGIDNFITTAEDDFFIVIADFFELAWPRVLQGEDRALEYINRAQQPSLLKDEEMNSIGQLIPAALSFFQALASDINHRSETILDKLQALRKGLLDGSIHGGGTELEASSAADIAIAAFYKYYETLDDSSRNGLAALTAKDSTRTLGSLFGLLFKPLGVAQNNGSRYCVALIGRDLESIINNNTQVLYQQKTNFTFYWHKQVRRCLDKPILAAVDVDDKHRFEYHLKSGDIAATLNAYIDDQHNTIFHQCLINSRVNIIAVLLAYDINYQLRNKQGRSPLYLAAQYGHLTVVERLLNNLGIEVNRPDNSDGVTPLFIAVYKGHLAVVERLLKHPAIDINQTNIYGETPLYIAALKGHLDVVNRLLNNSGIEVNRPDSNDGVTPLFVAVYKGHLAVVECLLNYRAIDINKPSNEGVTPLHVAAQEGHLAIIEHLLNHRGIKVNQTNNNDGVTPLYIAAEQGHLDVVNRLLQYPGIDINQTDSDGVTPLYIAAQNGHLAVVDSLLKYPGIGINQTDINGETPLYIATLKGHLDVVNRLLNNLGIEANRPDNNDGMTPLFVAVYKGHLAVVERLLKHPAIDINKPINKGATPLYIAALKGHLAVVECLLKNPDIEFNRPDTYGETPLYIAALKGHLEIVNCLLNKPGIEINQPDNNGVTPLYVAVKKGHVAVLIKLFEQSYFSSHLDEIINIFTLVDESTSLAIPDFKMRLAQIALEHHINHATEQLKGDDPLDRFNRGFNDIIKEVSWVNRHSPGYKLILGELQVQLLAEVGANIALIANHDSEIRRILGYQCDNMIPNFFGTTLLGEFESLVASYENTRQEEQLNRLSH